MAQEAGKLTVRLSAQAADTLDSIWLWNAAQYGSEHANRYVDFLRAETFNLESVHRIARPVPGRKELHYVTIKKRRGYGHVVVFEAIGKAIVVHNDYHTAQNWKEHLGSVP